MIYNNLLKDFKKIKPIKRFNNYYMIYTLFGLLLTCFLIYYFKINSLIIFFINFFLAGFTIFIYAIFDMKNYLTIEEMKTSLINKIKNYLLKISLEKTDYLVMLLKSYNITNKEDIKLFIEYYSNKHPITIKTSVWDFITSISITIASLVIVFVNVGTGKINIEALKVGLINLAVIVLIIVTVISLITFLLNFVINTFKEPEINLYTDITDELTYIYLRYDKYFPNKLNNNLEQKYNKKIKYLIIDTMQVILKIISNKIDDK